MPDMTDPYPGGNTLLSKPTTATQFLGSLTSGLGIVSQNDVTITNNNVTPNDSTGFPASAIALIADNQGSPARVRANITGNTVPNGNATDYTTGFLEFVIATAGAGATSGTQFEGIQYATSKKVPVVITTRAGSGRILVNRRPFEDYFPRETLRMVISQPLQLTNTLGQFDAIVNVGGGGPTGQAGAVRHGIARALLQFDDKLRQTLKRAGLLTRDPRMKERKKYGLKRARKAPQYTKR